MKRTITLLCAALLMCGTTLAQRITSVTATNKNELTTAIKDAATLTPGDIAYIYIKGSINLGSLTFGATTRNIHFVGVNDEESGDKASLLAEFVFPSNESEADKFALTFENLNLQDNNGCWGNSKHFINFKDANKHYVDSMVYKNCDINNICRSFIRGQIDGAPSDGSYTGCGTFNYFEMSNCRFHNGSRQSNAMPLIYMAWSTNTMVFRNNTFYDLTYLNALVTFNYMTDDTGRQAIKFIFENNTVCAYAKSTLFNFGQYVTTDSEFHIKNNFFLFPTWIDEANNRVGDSNGSHDMSQEATTVGEDGATTFGYMSQDEVNARIEKGTTLTNILGGLVQLENNVMLGYKYQDMAAAIEAGDIIPIGNDETQEADFSSMTMEEAGFSWGDFVDAQNDMFLINNQHKVYTAGKDGAPIGDVNNFTDQVIKEVSVNVKAQGSSTVDVIIDPVQEKYFSGNKITITLVDHNTALRTLNTFKGWSDGSMEKSRTIELEDNLELTANYEPAIDGMVSYFDFTKTPAAGQNKLPSYEADVYAEGYKAVATMMFVPDLKDEEDNVIGLADDYKVADGSEKRFNWRAGKFGEDDATEQISVLSRKTSASARSASKPDFLVFTFPTKGLNDIEFAAFCGTDNFGYKTQLADYSIDGGATWTNFAKVDLESRAATFSIGDGVLWGWNELKGQLPAAANDQEQVMVRIIGDVAGEMIVNGISEIDQATANMFEYTGAVVITAGGGLSGIANVAADNVAANAPVYNLMGMKVGSSARGLLIKNGKKYIVK